MFKKNSILSKHLALFFKAPLSNKNGEYSQEVRKIQKRTKRCYVSVNLWFLELQL
jgi:hypothetical protein